MIDENIFVWTVVIVVLVVFGIDLLFHAAPCGLDIKCFLETIQHRYLFSITVKQIATLFVIGFFFVATLTLVGCCAFWGSIGIHRFCSIRLKERCQRREEEEAVGLKKEEKV